MDFTKTCWYCGRNDMEPFDGYYCCANCGATWNEVIKLSPPTVVVEKTDAILTRYRPSRRLIRVGRRIKKRKVKDATDI